MQIEKRKTPPRLPLPTLQFSRLVVDAEDCMPWWQVLVAALLVDGCSVVLGLDDWYMLVVLCGLYSISL